LSETLGVVRSAWSFLPRGIRGSGTQMPQLISVEWGSKRYTLLRWGSHISIMYTLAVLFVVPHDPSTRLPAHQVGSGAFNLGGRAPPGWAEPNSRAAVKANAAVAYSSSNIVPTVTWLARCAVARPGQTARVIKRVTPSLVTSVKSASLQIAGDEADEDGAQQPAPWPLAGSEVATSVEDLRALHGPRRSWWGDLSPSEARELYHSLLPVTLLDEDSTSLPLGERARLAVAARRAARIYVRERTVLPVTLACEVMDGARTLLKQGSFQKAGLSEEQLWAKYAEKAGLDPRELVDATTSPEPSADEAEVYYTILNKACSTNRLVDGLVGGSRSTQALLGCAAAAEQEVQSVCDVITGGM